MWLVVVCVVDTTAVHMLVAAAQHLGFALCIAPSQHLTYIDWVEHN